VLLRAVRTLEDIIHPHSPSLHIYKALRRSTALAPIERMIEWLNVRAAAAPAAA
jgi:hypothetical protein